MKQVAEVKDVAVEDEAKNDNEEMKVKDPAVNLPSSSIDPPSKDVVLPKNPVKPNKATKTGEMYIGQTEELLTLMKTNSPI